MPKMGRPVTDVQSSLSNVTMRPKKADIDLSKKELSKQEVLDKATGRKTEDPRFARNVNNKMGKDEFLKLLTHQLENQDPMNPVDQQKFSAELAQYSQLEQLTNLNSKFDRFGKDQEMQNQFYAASFIGKEVVTDGNTLKIQPGESGGDIIYNLPNKAKQVLIRIFDSKNQMVGEIREDDVSRGGNKTRWDGKTLDGTPTAAGNYTVQVMGWGEDLQPLDIKTQNRGIVETVSFDNGETVLLVDNKKVFLRDVKSFHLAKGQKLNHNQKTMGTPNTKKPLMPNAHLARELSGEKLGGRTIKEEQVNELKNKQQAASAYNDAKGIYD